VPVLATAVLPTPYEGDGGLALAGEGVTDTPMLTDRRFPTQGMATPTAVEAILPTVIRTFIHELFEKHAVAEVDHLWERRWATCRLERDVPAGPMYTAIRTPVFLTPPGAGGVAGEAGGAAEAVASAGAGMRPTGTLGGKS